MCISQQLNGFEVLHFWESLWKWWHTRMTNDNVSEEFVMWFYYDLLWYFMFLLILCMEYITHQSFAIKILHRHPFKVSLFWQFRNNGDICLVHFITALKCFESHCGNDGTQVWLMIMYLKSLSCCFIMIYYDLLCSC